MDVQNATGLSALKPVGAATATVAPLASAAAAAPPGAAAPPTAVAASANSTLPPAALTKAADTLQKQANLPASSVALSAGLDPSGGHPGQLLVELKDKQTQQVFVRYYVPAERVVQVAAQAADQPMAPGSLLQEKA